MTTQNATAIERSEPNTLPAPAPSQQPVAQQGDQSTWYYRPSADIFESSDAYTILLDMPGVSSENLEITFGDHMLTVHGHVSVPEWMRERRAGRQVIRTEYGIGDYFRRFEIGRTIDVENITAECASGVVRIHLPKVEAAKPVKITVTPSRA